MTAIIIIIGRGGVDKRFSADTKVPAVVKHERWSIDGRGEEIEGRPHC